MLELSIFILIPNIVFMSKYRLGLILPLVYKL